MYEDKYNRMTPGAGHVVCGQVGHMRHERPTRPVDEAHSFNRDQIKPTGGPLSPRDYPLYM